MSMAMRLGSIARASTKVACTAQRTVSHKAAVPVATNRALRAFFSNKSVCVQQRCRVQRMSFHTRSVIRAEYGSESTGDFPSLEYRIFYTEGGKKLSPWHDIPLFNADGTLNFICEIPKETKAKMEVATDEEFNPIKQDTKKGKLRDYPYPINWNYGMLPKTWEDPAVKNPEVEDMAGDNDPVDLVEIGSKAHPMGSVVKVKVLGCYAMIDDGELDWKVIGIDVNDPKAGDLNDVEDVERVFPGELEKIRVWFRDYKMPAGKPANAYGYNDKCMNKEFTMGVIKETAEFYEKLKSGTRANDVELSLV